MDVIRTVGETCWSEGLVVVIDSWTCLASESWLEALALPLDQARSTCDGLDCGETALASTSLP